MASPPNVVPPDQYSSQLKEHLISEEPSSAIEVYDEYHTAPHEGYNCTPCNYIPSEQLYAVWPYESERTVPSQGGVDIFGKPVLSNEAKSNEERRAQLRSTLMTTISLVTGAIVTVLALRFGFRLLGADPSNWIVMLIYVISGPFELGFNGLFGNVAIGAYSVFEFPTLIAILMYELLATEAQMVVRALLPSQERNHLA